MKKQRTQLIVLLVVVVLLLLGIKGVSYLKEKQEAEELKTENVLVLQLEQEYITEIGYSYEGEEYSFVKKEDIWYAAEDESLSITQYMITAMEDKITPLAAWEQIDDVQDLSQYGLAEPARYVKCVADGVTYEILIGDYNDLTGQYYICFAGEDTVYTVAEAFVLAFNKTLEDVVEEVDEETVQENSEEITEESTETGEGAEDESAEASSVEEPEAEASTEGDAESEVEATEESEE